MSITRSRAQELLRSCVGRHLVVAGDLMLDRYVVGEVDRISPEAPVPVLHVHKEHAVPGGACNVALNVAMLGGVPELVGWIGSDLHGEALLDLVGKAGIGTDGVARLANRPTTVKTRVMADRQQICRVDREDTSPVSSADMEQMLSKFTDFGHQSHAIILEDYGKGVIEAPLLDAARQLASEGIPVGIDPKENHRLALDGLGFATPNRKEAWHAAGAAPDDPVDRVGRALLKQWQLDWLLVTLGPDGMMLFEDDACTHTVPTRAREVFDVSGAGDTVIAVCTLALAAGASRIEAAELANYAAGVVVAKVGTATVSPDELLQAVPE